MTIARRNQVSVHETPYYHCIARCVRRAFLCGEDHLTGQNYEHRRQWIVDKLAQLSGVFAIDVCAYAVMSNHYHVVLRINLEQATAWSDNEVVERWLALFNGPVLIHRLVNDDLKTSAERQKAADIINNWRERLCDLSWFMRCLNESIARQANAEDRCRGRFWEGRFKSQALLDDAALLTCMSYVDLNPIRVGLAETPEDSEYTSIQERIRQHALRQHEQDDASGSVSIPADTPARDATVPALLPLLGNEKKDQLDTGIPFHIADYLRLVDWTGRAIRDDKRGAIPVQLAPILRRLGLDEQGWVDNVEHFGRCFHRAVGPIEKLRQLSQTFEQRWLRGLQASRALYRPLCA